MSWDEVIKGVIGLASAGITAYVTITIARIQSQVKSPNGTKTGQAAYDSREMLFELVRKAEKWDKHLENDTIHIPIAIVAGPAAEEVTKTPPDSTMVALEEEAKGLTRKIPGRRPRKSGQSGRRQSGRDEGSPPPSR